MIPTISELEAGKRQNKAKKLNRRLPRVGKVVFNSDTGPVHCNVKEFTAGNAILTMSGWLGLPSRFTLYVEPDAVRAECVVLERKGSNVRVEFMDVIDGVRFRQD